jgi:uracil-DNA glycosylase family 4
MQLGFQLDDEAPPQANVLDIIRELSTNCSNCRLAQLHPQNPGLVSRGNPQARIAVVGIAPGDAETEKGVPLVGPSGKEFEKWMRFINISTATDTYVTNLVQCQPPKKLDNKSDRMKQRDPDRDEITACFGPRTMRILHAMPKLEVVITLGWLPALQFLGSGPNEDQVPGSKTHEGQWFETSLLPGKGIFCLSHPAELLYSDSPEKRMIIENCLRRFKREYLESGRILQLIQKARTTREAQGGFNG